MPKRIDPEVKARAVSLMGQHAQEYGICQPFRVSSLVGLVSLFRWVG